MLIGGLGLLGSSLTLAQTTPQSNEVLQAPPAIQFTPWREVNRTETNREYLVTFPSSVTTPVAVNNVVSLRVILPASNQPVPVVLVMHYWGATDLRVERALADELNRQGVGAALLTLPYHLTRTPPGIRSGQLAIEPDPVKLGAMMRQSVLDARRSLDFLVTRPEIDPARIGISGISLGALVTSLTFAVDDRPIAAAFMLGGADLAQLMWTSSRVVAQRDILRRQGYTEDRLRRELAEVEPLNYLNSRREADVFIVAGKFDTVVTRGSTMALISAFSRPKQLWLDTGHYGGIFVQRKLMREVARFFGDTFAKRSYEPPIRLIAPTLRVGFSVGSDGDRLGVNLGVGLDIYRFDRRGDGFASVIATPRGAELFLGQRLTQGIALGLSLSPRRVSPVLYWSAVL